LESWLAEIEDRAALSAEDAAMARETFEGLIERLPEDLQQIFIWKLESRSNAEISRLINRTERTVELKMKIIRKSLERGSVTGDFKPPG
jgi:DNA-directed RNA polymerase specialized sigma24 family protein